MVRKIVKSNFVRSTGRSNRVLHFLSQWYCNGTGSRLLCFKVQGLWALSPYLANEARRDGGISNHLLSRKPFLLLPTYFQLHRKLASQQPNTTKKRVFRARALRRKPSHVAALSRPTPCSGSCSSRADLSRRRGRPSPRRSAGSRRGRSPPRGGPGRWTWRRAAPGG